MVDKQGNTAVKLVATDSPGGNPSGPGIVYVASFELDGGPARPAITFELPGGTHVDLTDVAPVPASSPVGIVRGPGLASIGNPTGTTNLVFVWDDGVTVTIPMPPGTGVAQIPNGDHGDILVSDLGAVLSIDPTIITPAARAILAEATIGDILGALEAAPLIHTHVSSDITDLSTGTGVTDGDKGHVIVSAAGATWLLNPTVVTPAALTVLDDADTTAMRATLGAAAAADLAAKADQAALNSTDAAVALRAPLAGPSFTGTQTLPDPRFTGGTPAATKAWLGVDGSGAGAWTPLTSAHVTDWREAVEDAVATVLAAGTGVSLAYNDAAGTFTISATGGGGGGITDPEVVRDTIGVALIGTGVITVTVDDAGDTITISTTATANSTDAVLLARGNHTGSQTLDTTTDTGTRIAMTPAERTKLTGVAAAATANSSDANLRDRATHTGQQSATTVDEATTRKWFTDVERTKLTGIATGATANSTDAALLARANHTGTQDLSTTTDSALRLAMTAAERAKLGGISPGATANSPDGTLVDRGNHTGAPLTGSRTVSATSDTLEILDATQKSVDYTSATAVTVGVPANSGLQFPVGVTIELCQLGAGQVTVAPLGVVVVRSAGGAMKLRTQYSTASLRKIATDEWVLVGDLTV